MPLPRFEKLDDEMKTALLDGALEEFAEHGFDAASIGDIVERAGISRGKLYYYFADKADLFVTVLRRSFARAQAASPPIPETLTAETYWEDLRDHWMAVARHFVESPLDIRIWRIFKQRFGAADGEESARVQQIVRAWHAPYQELFLAGQRLGTVREDLPIELLFAVVRAVDGTVDAWFLEHAEEPSENDVTEHVRIVFDLHRRLLEPPPPR